MEKTRKLTSNEQKVRKKLEKFPQGTKEKTLEKELVMRKTAVYEALNGLEQNGKAFRGEHGLWYPELPSSKPTRHLGFFERRRIAAFEKERSRVEALDQDMLKIDRICAARKEKLLLPEGLKGLERMEKEHEIMKKHGLL